MKCSSLFSPFILNMVFAFSVDTEEISFITYIRPLNLDKAHSTILQPNIYILKNNKGYT